MSLGVSQSLANAISRSEIAKSCIENGGHFFGNADKWHKRYFRKSGKVYFVRYTVCSKCGLRQIDNFYPHDGANKPEGEIEF